MNQRLIPPPPIDLMARHAQRFAGAQRACRERDCWSPFPDTPAGYPDSAAAQAAGRAAFEAHLGRAFELDDGLALPVSSPNAEAQLGEEVSPYTQQPLGVSYARREVDALFDAAGSAMQAWSTRRPRNAITRCSMSARIRAASK